MSVFNFFFTKKREREESIVKQAYIPINDFSTVFEKLYILLGIDDLHNHPILIERLSKLAKEENIQSCEEFIDTMDKDKLFYQAVIDAVTVNETYFLREKHTLNWLVDYIVKNNRIIKILSMPSSSGEEVYSILLLLHKIDPKLLNNVHITGIDVNQKAIDKAKKGVYTERVLHRISEQDKKKYFLKSEDGFQIDKIFKKNTNFIRSNLFDLSSKTLGLFDIVLSRNLFIYFDETHREKATRTLLSVLKDNGILIMGHADIIKPNNSLIKLENSIYKKI